MKVLKLTLHELAYICKYPIELTKELRYNVYTEW